MAHGVIWFLVGVGLGVAFALYRLWSLSTKQILLPVSGIVCATATCAVLGGGVVWLLSRLFA